MTMAISAGKRGNQASHWNFEKKTHNWEHELDQILIIHIRSVLRHILSWILQGHQ
jgi:hypothetical protein